MTKRMAGMTMKKTIGKTVTLMEKLKKYGFSDYTIENLMKGKIVTVAYGKVKYDSKSGTLKTFYPD